MTELSIHPVFLYRVYRNTSESFRQIEICVKTLALCAQLPQTHFLFAPCKLSLVFPQLVRNIFFIS